MTMTHGDVLAIVERDPNRRSTLISVIKTTGSNKLFSKPLSMHATPTDWYLKMVYKVYEFPRSLLIFGAGSFDLLEGPMSNATIVLDLPSDKIGEGTITFTS